MGNSYFGYGRVLPHQKFLSCSKTFVSHFLPLLIADNTLVYTNLCMATQPNHDKHIQEGYIPCACPVALNGNFHSCPQDHKDTVTGAE